MRELILGGQKSGKSRAAESRALAWLQVPGREAELIATAIAGDAEMTERIERHRQDRQARVPALRTFEVGSDLGAAISSRSTSERLLIVDCLTLWLTQRLMPLAGPPANPAELRALTDGLVDASRTARGPLVFVSNEIGFGVSPLSADVRQFIDALGVLHQALAETCDRVTLMVAGCELTVRNADHA